MNRIVDQQREATLPTPQPNPFIHFMRNFEIVVEERTENPARRLDLLLRFTSGEAHDLIKECVLIEPSNAGYEHAKPLLHKNYRQPQVLAAAYKSKAESWDPILVGR